MARAYSKELLKAQAEGAKIVRSIGPVSDGEVVYSPRRKGDPQPWLLKTDTSGAWRYSGRECHAEWGPDGKPVALTETQEHIVKCLVDRGDWYPGCGWHWANRSSTIRHLDGLVRKGVVIRTSDKPYNERYALSDLGHRQFNKPVMVSEEEVKAVLVMLAEQGGEWSPRAGWWYRNIKLTRLCLAVLVSHGLVASSGDTYGLKGDGYDAAREAGYNPDLLMDEEY